MKPLRAALVAVLALLAGGATAPPGVVPVVAAENMYGDVARQIGGAHVAVTSILSNPDQDPHLFEASAAVARAVSGARIVVLSGIDYDPWMRSLLDATRGRGRAVIDVAAEAGRKPGENPHVWYDTRIMALYARRLASRLAAIDPADAPAYRANLAAFEHSLAPIDARIATLAARLYGVPVAATEPVFGYMLDALGMVVREAGFQLAVMNNTEPSPREVAAFEADLRGHRVAMLVYNSQATDPVAARMEAIAHRAGVPVIGATETEPPGLRWQAWMMRALDAVDAALPARPH